LNPAHILIVDDELAVVQGCSKFLTKAGHVVDTALTPVEAVRRIEESDREYDILVLDLKLAGDPEEGLLKRLLKLQPDSAVVIIVGPATVAAAFETMEAGSHQHLPKPFTNDDLTAALDRALSNRTILLQTKQAREDQTIIDLDELIWLGPGMQKTARIVSRVAPTGSSVLIIGEAGTGKMSLAQAIHRASPRRIHPLTIFDMRANREQPISEQLFGYVVKEDRINKYIPGKIEETGSGTLYLREIVDLSVVDQARLLNAIRKRQYMPIRGEEARPLSCRFVFGTEHDLKKQLQKGTVSEDLYNSLIVFPIYLPSLSERSEAIPALSYQFLRRYAQQYHKPVVRLDENLLTRLLSRQWKKNTRELSQCIDRMVSICEGDTLDLSHYQQAMGDGLSIGWSGLPPSTSEELKAVKKRLRRAAVEEVEKSFIKEALRRADGNITQAAKNVNMHRRNFQTMMKQYGIKGDS